MSNSYTEARKKALSYLGLAECSDIPYTDIAKRLVFKDGSVIEDINLNDKSAARELIRAWASITEYRNGAI